MKRRIFLLTLIASLFVISGFVSCKEDPTPEPTPGNNFEKLADFGVYNGTDAVLKFAAADHQMYIKKGASNSVFRLLNNDGSKYIEVDMTAIKLSQNDVVTAVVKDVGFNVVTGQTYSFKVVKSGLTQKWLQEVDGNLGLIIYWAD